jgi:hypothetical protein
MSEPIQVGDLVVIVGMGCPHGIEELGRVFRVGEVVHEHTLCQICHKRHGLNWCVVDPADDDLAYPFSWLKRIPPLSELDDVKHDEEITA